MKNSSINITHNPDLFSLLQQNCRNEVSAIISYQVIQKLSTRVKWELEDDLLDDLVDHLRAQLLMELHVELFNR